MWINVDTLETRPADFQPTVGHWCSITDEQFNSLLQLPWGYTLSEVDGQVLVTPKDPPPARDYDAERLAVWERIKVERDRRAAVGGFKVDTHWFHSDAKSRTQQLGLSQLATITLFNGGTMADPIPGVPPWKTMTGEEVTITVGLALQILQNAAVSEGLCFDAAKAHKQALWESPDPINYDFSGGWPLMFGE